MTKRDEEWSNSEICIMFAYCVFFYIVGVFLLYFKVLYGLGFVFVSTLLFVPTLIEARKKIRRYWKKVRMEKLRKNQETVIIGGIPQDHHHKKKKKSDIFDYYVPIIDDNTSKGKMMKELGLWYEKSKKTISFEEKEPVNTTKSPIPGRTYRQLSKLFDALNHYKRIRIAHQANIGAGHHGDSIKKMLKAEAKRRGLDITVTEKGKDVIISMPKRSEKRVV